LVNPHHETEQPDATEERQQHLPRPPRVTCGIEQPIDNGDETTGAGDGTPIVGLNVLAFHPALVDQARHDKQRERSHWQVDEENPAPRRVVDDRAGNDGPRRTTEAGDTAPDAECLHPLARVGKQQCDQTEGRRRGQCFAAALQEPRADEHPARDGRTAERRGEREQANTPQEEPPTAHDVGEPPAEEQEAASHEHVSVDHPGEPRGAEVQVVLDVRERDVHDRDVEDQHELDQREHRQCLPTPRVRLCACSWYVAHGCQPAMRV
jgi:hypothetical protein